MLMSEDDDDSPMPSTRVLGRIPAHALARAAAHRSPRPLSTLHNAQRTRPRGREALSKAENMLAAQRSAAVAPALASSAPQPEAPASSMSQTLQMRLQPSPLAANPPPCAAATSLPSAAPAAAEFASAEDEDAEDNRSERWEQEHAVEAAQEELLPSAQQEVPAREEDQLGLSNHLASLASLAAVPEHSSAELASALQAALGAAVSSLTAVEQQQAGVLRAGVDELKDDFRARLEALEAEFVRRAEGLSAELAGHVAERKRDCIEAVAQHAEQLSTTLLTIKGGVEGVGGRRPATEEWPGVEQPEGQLGQTHAGNHGRARCRHPRHRASAQPRLVASSVVEALGSQLASTRAALGADAADSAEEGSSHAEARRAARLEAGIDDRNSTSEMARQVPRHASGLGRATVSARGRRWLHAGSDSDE